MLPDILKDNLRIPVIGSPMFIVSNPTLVAAQCKAGIVGSFPALNARPQSLLKDWIREIKDDPAVYKEENPTAKVAPLRSIRFVTLQMTASFPIWKHV